MKILLALTALALLAGCSVAQAHPRPVWNGHGYYPSDGIQPLCPAADAGHHAVIGRGKHAFRVQCTWDDRMWLWDLA
jgi:hypothetical protein